MSDTNRFGDNGDSTVTDTLSGLMWTKTDTMNDLEKWVNYIEAKDYVRILREKKFAGFDDWRLPQRDEMPTLYDELLCNKDQFGKINHISEAFANGGGFSLIGEIVSGRMRTWIYNTRTGEFSQPDGLWIISEAARAVRTIKPAK